MKQRSAVSGLIQDFVVVGLHIFGVRLGLRGRSPHVEVKFEDTVEDGVKVEVVNLDVGEQGTGDKAIAPDSAPCCTDRSDRLSDPRPERGPPILAPGTTN